MKKVFVLAAISVLTGGCAVESTTNEEGVAPNPEAAEAVGTTQQALLACPNDVFSELEWNVNQDGAMTPWTAGCVAHRVELGLLDMDHPVLQEAVADFPQYEGVVTPEKLEACRNSYIEVWTGEKFNAQTSSYSNLGYWKYMAKPVVSALPTLRITSCRAYWYRGAACSWNVPLNYDYTRVDVRGVPNGNLANTNASRVYTGTQKYVDCGSL